MLTNIIDRRKRPYRFLKVNAIIEPTRHDHSVDDSDRIDSPPGADWMGYDEREHISLSDAIKWADSHADAVTLYLYDEDGGLYVVHSAAAETAAQL